MRLLSLVAGLMVMAGAEAGQVQVEVVAVSQENASTALQGIAADPSVRFWLQPLNPKQNNQSQAKIELYYSCKDVETGYLIADCFIDLQQPAARLDAGGHYAGHADNRPTGRHQPSSGWTDSSTGRFHTTFYASEVGGIVDVTINCSTGGFGTCTPGTTSFGVGYTGLVELSSGRGYVLVGDKPSHPSNHWAVPEFTEKVAVVAGKYVDQYPQEVLRYNDMSLELGGVFDVATASASGYDWTPPHKSHRTGNNMDLSFPRTNEQRNFLEKLYRSVGVSVLREDNFHWHLTY